MRTVRWLVAVFSSSHSAEGRLRRQRKASRGVSLKQPPNIPHRAVVTGAVAETVLLRLQPVSLSRPVRRGPKINLLCRCSELSRLLIPLKISPACATLPNPSPQDTTSSLNRIPLLFEVDEFVQCSAKRISAPSSEDPTLPCPRFARHLCADVVFISRRLRAHATPAPICLTDIGGATTMVGDSTETLEINKHSYGGTSGPGHHGVAF